MISTIKEWADRWRTLNGKVSPRTRILCAAGALICFIILLMILMPGALAWGYYSLSAFKLVPSSSAPALTSYSSGINATNSTILYPELPRKANLTAILLTLTPSRAVVP